MIARPPFEELDHTADVGLRVYGADFAALCVHAARGMTRLMLDADVPAVAAVSETISVAAEGHEAVLHAWLSELLYHCTVRKLLPVDFQPRNCDEHGLSMELRSVQVDEALRRDMSEIKAVTWHALHVWRDERGWVATVIFDT